MEPRGKNRHGFLLLVVLGVFCSLIFVLHPKLASANSGEPNFYYYSSGRKIPLVLSKKMLAVRFKESIGSETKEKIVKSEANLGSFLKRKELSIFNITLLPLRAGLREENIIQTISSLTTKSEVEAVFPLFGFPDPVRILTDEFIVKFNPNTSEEEIRAFNTLHNVEIARKPEWTDRYTLKLKDPTNMNTLKTANLYYENPITVFSMPNFIGKLKPAQITPDDTYFPQQWPLDNTGFNSGETPGTLDADIYAPEGWDISTGSSDIVIAILDEGVDLDHNDLVNKLVAGYDFFDDDNDPSPYQDDAHGTACAGLAAAETNNGLGIAGVCWNCKIMPIRVASSEYYYWVKEEAAANGITWAANNGADVLSCSWSELGDNDAIHDAIINAKNNGREGKGCVLVYAAHNYNRLLTYPSKYPEVIAVGATDHNDDRWDLGCVGINGCGSNFGPELDVVAPSGWGPGQGVIMWTTDISGSAGYNDGDLSKGDADGNYTKWFGGTSAATPEVAGLAGLILSVNPDLTADEVQFIIESTADDQIGDPLEDTEGWDQYYGWGRINNESALLEAVEFPTDDELVGWWKFDEGEGTIAHDSAGDNDGTLNGPPDWVSGKVGDYALDFNGVADNVSLSPIGALVTSSVTVAAWIDTNSLSANSPIVTQYHPSNYRGYYLFLWSNDKPAFGLGAADYAESEQAISKDKWYHLAGTYNDFDLKIYVDGVLRGTKDLQGEAGANTNAYIGFLHEDPENDFYFDGTIDDVRVYNYALDMFEIWDAMSGDAPRFRIKDSSGETVAWFDSFGNLFLKGEKLEDPADPIPPGSFIIKDSEDVPVAYIDNQGNLWINGSLSELSGSCNPEGDAFIIRNSSDADVGYIDFANGDLCLTGKLYQNPEP